MSVKQFAFKLSCEINETYVVTCLVIFNIKGVLIAGAENKRNYSS